jgi:hypothetical protein
VGGELDVDVMLNIGNCRVNCVVQSDAYVNFGSRKSEMLLYQKSVEKER